MKQGKIWTKLLIRPQNPQETRRVNQPGGQDPGGTARGGYAVKSKRESIVSMDVNETLMCCVLCVNVCMCAYIHPHVVCQAKVCISVCLPFCICVMTVTVCVCVFAFA